MHQPGEKRLLGIERAAGLAFHQQAGRDGAAQTVLPEAVGQLAERGQLLGAQQLAHGNGQCGALDHLQPEPGDRGAEVAHRGVVAPIEYRVGELEQARGDERLGFHHGGDLAGRQVRVLQTLAQAQGGIEIHGKDDFAGKFLGDVFKHGKTLGVEFGTVFIGSGLEVGFGHGGSWEGGRLVAFRGRGLG